VFFIDDEALIGQREAALLAVEAILVPGVSFVVHHVGAVAEPCSNRSTCTASEASYRTHSHSEPGTAFSFGKMLFLNLKIYFSGDTDI